MKKQLKVIDYLNSGKSLNDLLEQHFVDSNVGKDGKFSLNYDQIKASNLDEIANECRGLIVRVENNKYVPVAIPFYRFFNYGQGAASISSVEEILNSTIYEKQDGCFLSTTMLSCWDGTKISIGEVVNKKLTPTLIGMNKEGEIVPCKVTNWFNNGRKNNWLELEVDLKVKGLNKKIKVTSNHHIFINDKFQAIENAKIGDNLRIICKKINNDAIHFIESAMLGDGTITKNGKNYRYEEGHKISHLEYSEYIKKCLGEVFSSSSKKTSGYGTQMICVSSIANESITFLREKWYPNGVKNSKRFILDG